MRARRSTRHAAGFSLLEVIGVLAVLSVLAGLLVPVIFQVIHTAFINQTASSLNSVRTACAGHCAQFGSIATDGSVNPPAAIPLDGSDSRSSQFDRVLLLEAFLEGVFSPKIGDGILGATNSRIQIVPGLPANVAADESNAAYNLDGTGSNGAGGNVVIEAIITGVPLSDARALNAIIDGPALAEDSSGNDLLGRVKYGNGNASNGNGNGNNNGNGNGNGNGGNNNGQGSGGKDSGTGTGKNGNTPTQNADTVTVHIYLTHR